MPRSTVSTNKNNLNTLEAFTSVNSRFQQNTNGLVTVSATSSTIFQNVRMATFVHSLCTSMFLGHSSRTEA